MDIIEDKKYWVNLQWPAAPNENDVDVFKLFQQGRTLLLGSTKLLLPLCDQAWDSTPAHNDGKIISRDWFSLDEHWDTIMIDGGLCFSKEFADKLIPIILANCDTFIARAFLNPSWPTKYATYFPKASELNPIPFEHPISEVYTFYIWKRKQS